MSSMLDVQITVMMIFLPWLGECQDSVIKRELVLFTDFKTQSDARTVCNDMGFRLAIIDSDGMQWALEWFSTTNEWNVNVRGNVWITLDLVDSRCTYMEKNALLTGVDTCQNLNQYLCQKETGSCTYSYGSGGCIGFFQSKTIHVNNRQECEDECSKMMIHYAPCWMYNYQSNTCDLYFDDDPYWCINSLDSSTVKAGFRNCFNLNISSYESTADTVYDDESFPLDYGIEITSTTERSQASQTEDFSVTKTLLELSTASSDTRTSSISSTTNLSNNTSAASLTTFSSATSISQAPLSKTASTATIAPSPMTTVISAKLETAPSAVIAYDSAFASALSTTVTSSDGNSSAPSTTTSSDSISPAPSSTVTSAATTAPIPSTTVIPPQWTATISTTVGSRALSTTATSAAPLSLNRALTLSTHANAVTALPPTFYSPSTTSTITDTAEYLKTTTLQFDTQVMQTVTTSVSTDVSLWKRSNTSSATATSLTVTVLSPSTATNATTTPTTSADGLQSTAVAPSSASVSVTPFYCPCRKFVSGKNNSNVQKLVTELIRRLRVDQSTLSSKRRMRESQSDERPAAQAVGYSGILFLTIILCCVALLDMTRIYSLFNNKVDMELT